MDRRAAIRVLSGRWSGSSEVRAALIHAAASEDVAVAAEARSALAESGPLGDAAVTACLDGFVRSAALDELVPLVGVLRARAELSPEIERSVRDVIDRGDAATNEVLIPLLAAAGAATMVDLRRLSTASPDATGAIVDTATSLIEEVPIADLLAAAGPQGRGSLIARIVESGKLPPRVRDGLQSLLRHEDAQVRFAAAELCGAHVVRDGPVMASARDALSDSDAAVRAAAAWALWKCEGHSASLISAIVRSLGERDARGACIRWLREIGPAAAIAAPRLAEIVESDESLETRLAACDAIAALRVEDSAVAAALSRALRAGYRSRWGAESLEEGVARALGTMGASAAGSIPDLIRVAQDELASPLSDAAAVRARCQSLVALGEIGGLDEAEVMVVRTLSTSSRVRDVRRVAGEVLRRIE